MTRAAEVAAALQSRIDAARFDANSPGGWCAAAEFLLRESQPEPAAVVGDDAALLAEATDFCDRYGHKSTGSQARTLVRRLSARIRSQRYHCTECGGTGRIAREASDADDHLSGSMDTPLKSGDKPCPYCEPEILKEAGDALENWPTRNMRDVRDLVINLCGSLRAALADVARLRVQRDLQRTAIQAQEERHSAAPAVGEDEKLLEQADKDAAYLHVRNWNDIGFTVQHLAARLRAALADLARLQRQNEEMARSLNEIKAVIAPYCDAARPGSVLYQIEAAIYGD